MLLKELQSDRNAGRRILQRPDRLWFHYFTGMVVVLCLIVGSYTLNRAMVDRGLAATADIIRGNEHIMIAEQIVQAADRLTHAQAPDFSSYNSKVARFAAIYDDMHQTDSRTDPDDTHAPGQTVQMQRAALTFLTLARRFATAPPPARAGLNRRLQAAYTAEGLKAELMQAGLVIAEQIKAEARQFTLIQRMLLVASGVVLLAEALLIFLPAQRSVRNSLLQMRRTTSELRASQTQLKDMNRQLEHTVSHDTLTGLPNRRSLTRYLTNMIAGEGRENWHLLLVGLDDFKSINDMVGHEQGDALLIAVSRALTDCVDFEHLVAHVGGDQFALITSENTENVITRVHASFHDPFVVGGRRVAVNASIGYLEVDIGARLPLDILADAEIALQYAKTAGGNRALAFTQHLREDLGMMQQMQLDLMDAIKNGEIEPWFQPQVRLSDGQLHGAEVLARWRHPTRGLLTPDKFLPAAERAGLMVDLDHAVWRAAMAQAKIWENAQTWQPIISLNAAPDTISDPFFLERFLLSLQRSGLSANQVIIEVLETTLINGKDDIAAINIDSLADCGIALELDDFGTGYASLSKLTQLPLSGIKLDRSLVAPLPGQAADSIIRAILALAGELGLHVIAEGIEENAQAVHLNERGCRIGQGYGFGRPMGAADFTTWLRNNVGLSLQAGPGLPRLASGT